MEQLGAPVRLTLGEYTNLKVTTPDDMVVAGQIGPTAPTAVARFLEVGVISGSPHV